MDKRAFLLWLALPALLAGCAGGTPAATPTVTVTETVTMTATPTSTPTPTASQTGVLKLGEAADRPNGASITVFEHRKNVEPQDPNQEAIDVQVCVGNLAPGENANDYPTVTNQFWSLRDAANRSYTPASSTWDHPGATPAFPVQQRVNWGDCVRGWVIIEGSKDTVMTTARYTNSQTGAIYEWQLPS